jgi:ryanodine receptor 2
MNYDPKPIDPRSVALPPEIVELTEKLAEHAHDVWAYERLKQGWTYGPKRDDANKKHPCLVPYAELPETEKVHDRNTAMQTLQYLVAKGYRITKG